MANIPDTPSRATVFLAQIYVKTSTLNCHVLWLLQCRHDITYYVCSTSKFTSYETNTIDQCTGKVTNASAATCIISFQFHGNPCLNIISISSGTVTTTHAITYNKSADSTTTATWNWNCQALIWFNYLTPALFWQQSYVRFTESVNTYSYFI